jgi:molybdate transport system substrate-binding protein
MSIILLVCLAGCDVEKYPEPEDQYKCELLAYCGETLVRPFMEITSIVEKKTGCRVNVSHGDSGHLFRSVKVNRIGDIFFPGSPSYLNNLFKEKIVVKSAEVGFNQVGLFVQPGNPQSLSGDLNIFVRKQIRTVLGSEKSGSIGRETKRVLMEAGIYEEALSHCFYLATDSRGLSNAIKNHDADVVMNWKAVEFFPENFGKMEFLPLDKRYVQKQPLRMGILKYSNSPDVAAMILDTAQSEVGQQIFRKYGF